MYNLDLFRAYNRTISDEEVFKLFSNPSILSTKANKTLGNTFMSLREEVFSNESFPTLQVEGLAAMDSVLVGNDFIYKDCISSYNMDNIPELPDGTFFYKQDDFLTADSWATTNGSQSVNNGKITLTSTTADMNFIRTMSPSYSGATNKIIKIKVKQIAGSSNPSVEVYYSTAGHAYNTSYYKLTNELIPYLNTEYVLTFDMSSLTAGGTDYTSNTITGLRFDFGNKAGQVFEIDWIYIGDGSYSQKLYDDKKINNLNLFNIAPTVGVRNKGLLLTGTASYASGIDTGFPNGNSARTISFWVKPTTLTASAGLLGYGTATNNLLFGVCLGSGNNYNKIVINKHGATSDPSTLTLEIGIWQHIGVTFYNEEVVFFINGVRSNSVILSSVNTTLSALYLGKDCASGVCFNGSISEVRFYATVLTDLDMIKLYQSPTNSISADTLYVKNANVENLLTSPVYQDWNAGFSSARVPSSNFPAWTQFTGSLYQYTFNIGDFVEMNSQEFTHDWKEGSQISFHIHWATNGVNASTPKGVRWEIEYSWANVGNVFLTPVTISGENTVEVGTASLTHYLTTIGTFTPPLGKVGSYLVFKVKRIASTVVPTRPTNNPFGLSVGIHYQINSLGSRSIMNK